jgi:hypothetical protein
VLFTSSGVAIERRRNVTKFVTAASLVRALQQGHSNVKVGVDNDHLVCFFLVYSK